MNSYDMFCGEDSTSAGFGKKERKPGLCKGQNEKQKRQTFPE